MRSTRRALVGGLILAAALATTLSGCQGPRSIASMGGSSTVAPPTSSAPAASPSPSATPTTDPVAGLIGPGCQALTDSLPGGSGTFLAMSTQPAATAMTSIPDLSSLVGAFSGELNKSVDLVNTLNTGQYTIFAPVNDAFSALTDDTLATLKSTDGAKTLTSVLTYHVVSARLTPEQITGTAKSVEGTELTLSGGPSAPTVDGVAVSCGNIQTANATVYLIGSLLEPAKN